MGVKEMPTRYERKPDERIKDLAFPYLRITCVNPFSETLTPRRRYLMRLNDATDEAGDKLMELLRSKTKATREDWREIHKHFIDWRYDEAARADPSYVNAELILDRVTEDRPNYDFIGDLGSLRENAKWDGDNSQWTEGRDTPASRMKQMAKQWAERRFAIEHPEDPNKLQNKVKLPNSGGIVDGNFILQGPATIEKARELLVAYPDEQDFIIQDSKNTKNFLIISGSEVDREKIFNAALDELTRHDPKSATLETWANIAYLMYQSPQSHRGSDAINRGFLAVAGDYMLDEQPFIPQDIDLRALVMNQKDFISYIVEYNKLRSLLEQVYAPTDKIL